MAAFGRNPFPRSFGGEPTPDEFELGALLDALAPGWDAADETESYAELMGHAAAVAMIWAVNERLRSQMIPARMLEALPTWEEILRVPPSKADSLQVRRARVAAKLLGIAGNALANLISVAQSLAGTNYVTYRVPDYASAWMYWPGINPGPPGLEWSSNLASVAIVLSRAGLSDDAFRNLLENMTQALRPIAASWMTFVLGTDDGGFVVDVGTLNLTFLAA